MISIVLTGLNTVQDYRLGRFDPSPYRYLSAYRFLPRIAPNQYRFLLRIQLTSPIHLFFLVNMFLMKNLPPKGDKKPLHESIDSTAVKTGIALVGMYGLLRAASWLIHYNK